MATTKAKDTDLISELASDLGISLDALDSMSMAKLKKIISSADIDPARKAALIRKKLSEARDAIDLAQECLAADADEEADEYGDEPSKKVA